MIKLNLLPIREEQKRHKMIQQVVLMVIVMLLVLAGNYFFYSYNQGKVDDAQNIVKKLKEQVKNQEHVLGDLKKEKKKKKEFLKRIDAINSLQGLRQNLLRILSEINDQIPHKTWLKNLKKENDKITLIGGAGTFEDVSTFAHSIKGEAKYFKDVNIKDVHIEEWKDSKDKNNPLLKNAKYVYFEIVCKLNLKEGINE